MGVDFVNAEDAFLSPSLFLAPNVSSLHEFFLVAIIVVVAVAVAAGLAAVFPFRRRTPPRFSRGFAIAFAIVFVFVIVVLRLGRRSVHHNPVFDVAGSLGTVRVVIFLVGIVKDHRHSHFVVDAISLVVIVVVVAATAAAAASIGVAALAAAPVAVIVEPLAQSHKVGVFFRGDAPSGVGGLSGKQPRDLFVAFRIPQSAVFEDLDDLLGGIAQDGRRLVAQERLRSYRGQNTLVGGPCGLCRRSIPREVVQLQDALSGRRNVVDPSSLVGLGFLLLLLQLLQLLLFLGLFLLLLVPQELRRTGVFLPETISHAPNVGSAPQGFNLSRGFVGARSEEGSIGLFDLAGHFLVGISLEVGILIGHRVGFGCSCSSYCNAM
mmetsp:Transcript_7660/g.22456  ORF Transcript_7660/g.22456 Transcript_7660/m.22456 type:complete len:378 (+) Transcript_7660:523-1656(+)